MAKLRRSQKKREPSPLSDEPSSWSPNKVPLTFRIFCIGVSLTLLAYGASGFLNNKLTLSTSKGGGGRLVFHDRPAWLLASAAIAGALVLLSVIVDHYDRRNNEVSYQLFRVGTLYLGFFLAAAAFAAYFYVGLFG